MTFSTRMVYGETQAEYLYPTVREALDKLRKDASSYGIAFGLADFGGLRTSGIVAQLIAWRDKAVENGEPYYRVAPYGKTYHAVGSAFDVRVTKKPASMTDAQAYRKLGDLALPHGLVWGGTFSDPADQFHFQSQLPLDVCAARWEKYVASGALPNKVGAIDVGVMIVLAVFGLLLFTYFAR